MIKRIKIQEKRTMTREEFITLSKDHILYLDGATGSNLVKAGMPSGVCPEQWILEHQDVMLQLQKDYVQAGTNILYAPTFTANRVKLAEYHLEKNMTSMIRDLVAISKKAAESTPGHPVYVAGDLTMTGEQLKPMGKMDLETLIDIYMLSSDTWTRPSMPSSTSTNRPKSVMFVMMPFTRPPTG